MTDNIPLADPIKERVKQGFERLLLAPVFLIYEIVAVLFPGVLFIILLLAKNNHSVISAFQNPILGYKTKICIAIALGYLAGKVFSIPTDNLRNHFLGKLVQDVQKSDSKNLQSLARKFLYGALYFPGLYASEHALDYLMMSIMNVSFSVTMGIVLVVSSCIPGDHGFRWVELTAGVLLFIRGHSGYKSFFELVVFMLGVTLSGEVQKLVPGASALQTAEVLLARIGATTQPQSTDPVPTAGTPLTLPTQSTPK
jgi:hypothetical protein